MSIPTDLQAGPRGDSGTATVALSARRKRFLAFFTFLALSTALVAQQPTGGGTANSPPDNPQPQQQTAPSAIAGVASDIGYVTHKSWFFPDIATSPEALTARTSMLRRAQPTSFSARPDGIGSTASCQAIDFVFRSPSARCRKRGAALPLGKAERNASGAERFFQPCCVGRSF